MGGAIQSFGESSGLKADPGGGPSTNALAQLAKGLLAETSGIRGGLIDRSTNFLEGGFDPTSTPAFDFARLNVNQQTDNARQNILSTLPAGGSLSQALTDLELNRANALTQAGSNIYNQELGQAFQTGFGAPLSTSAASLGQAGNIQSQIAMQNAGNLNQKIGGTKSGIGYGMGAGM